MKLGFRLGIGFGVIVLLLLALGLTSYQIFNNIRDTSVELSRHNLAAIRYATEVERFALECVLQKEYFESDQTDTLFKQIAGNKDALLSATTELKTIAKDYRDEALEKKTDAAVSALNVWWGFFQQNRDRLLANNKLSLDMNESGLALSAASREFVTTKEKEYQLQMKMDKFCEDARMDLFNARFNRRGYRLFKRASYMDEVSKSIAAARKNCLELATLLTDATTLADVKDLIQSIEKYAALTDRALKETDEAKLTEFDESLTAAGSAASKLADALAKRFRDDTSTLTSCFFASSGIESNTYRLRMRHQRYQLSNTEKEDDQIWSEIQTHLKDLDANVKQLAGMLKSPEEKARLSVLIKNQDAYGKAIAQWRENRELLDLQILPKLSESSQLVIKLAREAQVEAWKDANTTDGEVADAVANARTIIIAVLSTRSAVSLAALALRPARLRTSSATTAKPLPCRPARAASTAAFRARRLVWNAISSIILTILAIFCPDSWISCIARTISPISLLPFSAAPRAAPARWLACVARSALSRV